MKKIIKIKQWQKKKCIIIKLENMSVRNFIQKLLKNSQVKNTNEKQPTIRDLLIIQSKNNRDNINIFADAMTRQIYKAWYESIKKNNNLYINSKGETCGNNDYKFGVIFKIDSKILENAAHLACENILADHPDISFKSIRGGDRTIEYQFCYENCLDDIIPLIEDL